MIAVIGHWEQGWTTPIMENDLWRFVMGEFDIDHRIMIPVSGIIGGKTLQERATLEECYDEFPDATFIFCDEKAERPLKSFAHPENAVYVFGRTSSSVLGRKREHDLDLKVESPQNGGGFWGHQAAAIILYDRFSKSGCY